MTIDPFSAFWLAVIIYGLGLAHGRHIELRAAREYAARTEKHKSQPSS